VFDTDTRRLFVAHEKTRGDMRGSGYVTSTDDIEIATFLGARGPGQRELVRLLTALFEERTDLPGRDDHVGDRLAPTSMT
jgi:hypothetical protein